MFKLVIQDDEGKTTVVPLIRDEITIGRKEGNTIRLTERNVSRRHARILRNNGEVQIEDLGSYNGIRVNNARIAERVSLRVSDQVQIGDYKLYLKAEGAEHADESRTLPHERMDTAAMVAMDNAVTTPVPVPAPAPTGTPTLPMGVPASAPGPSAAPAVSGLANAQIVGNPNRTLVAIADTDPAGRPVATAAQVAAMAGQVGYGRLVILSSNFAGKEFELSRPQMIVGRTDENDIVVNHRSISRNHAKVVREPDTGRYTISDLQSSNGVRVNGQDYGKVELRRGDVVDLGHVRFRFVEPGEDFVFARDAVVTDVPEAGGRRGLLVALLLAALVLGGVGIYVAFIKDKEPASVVANPGNGTGAQLPPGGSGSDQVAVVDPVLDAGVVVFDAAAVVTNPPDTTQDDVLACAKLQAENNKWNELLDCSMTVKDKVKAAEFRAKATMEIKAETAARNIDDAIKRGDFKAAKAALGRIPEDSVSRAATKQRYDEAWSLAADDYLARARTAADDKKCREVTRIQREAEAKGVGDRAKTVVCKAEVATQVDNPPKNPNPPGNGSDTPPPPKPPECDADALRERALEHNRNGMHAAELASYEQSFKCKSDGSLYRFMYMAACNSKQPAKAKSYFGKLSPQQQASMAQMCMRHGIDPKAP